MKVFYVDEHGDHSVREDCDGAGRRLKAGVSPRFILSAVGIHDSSRKPLAAAISEIKVKHFGPDVFLHDWVESELKGRHLMRAARSVTSGHVLDDPAMYSRLTTPESVNALLNDVALLFATFRPTIFAAVVDKNELLRSRRDPSADLISPLGAAYAYLQQRVSLMMERVHEGEAAMLVADQQTQHEAYFRSGEMHRIRDGLTRGLRRQPNFSLVLDKPLWIDTALSTWDREILQLPDVVAYTVAAWLQRGEPPSERCYMWDQIGPLLALNWNSGKVRGGGLAIFPRGSRYPRM